MEELKEYIELLKSSFPNSFINHNEEFIAHQKANEYFILKNCKTPLDIECKVLEWFSRAAFKTEPYSTRKRNDEFHTFMLNGINSFLDTNFSKDDMEIIYTYLGNACHHTKTIEFIKSDYNLDILQPTEKGA